MCLPTDLNLSSYWGQEQYILIAVYPESKVVPDL